MTSSLRREIFDFPVSERLLLVEELWDSNALENADVPITVEQRDELDRRLAGLERDPGSGDSWDTMRSRIVHPK